MTMRANPVGIVGKQGQCVGIPHCGPSASKERNRRLASIRRRHSSASSCDMLPKSSNTPTNRSPSRISPGVIRPAVASSWRGMCQADFAATVKVGIVGGTHPTGL